MLEIFKSLTLADVIYAALIAFVATQFLTSLSRISRARLQNVDGDVSYQGGDKNKIIKKCIAMFPLETIYFRGKVFSKGMQVRVTTFQKKIIEGEIIGKNDMDILCILVGHHIIAHEISKIEDMIEMPQIAKDNSFQE